MVRTQSGFGNANRNDNANQRPMIVRTPEVATTPELISIAGVQAMIRAMMAEQRDEMRQMLGINRDEPTVVMVQLELNEGQSEEGNYSQTISQVEPRVVRKNQPNEGNDGH